MILFKCDHRGCKKQVKSGGVWYDERSGRDIVEQPDGGWLMMSDGKVYCPKHTTEARQIERYDMDPERRKCIIKPCGHKALLEVIFCRDHNDKYNSWKGTNRMKSTDTFCDLHGGMKDFEETQP